MNTCAIIIPIYKSKFSKIEEFNIQTSLCNLKGFEAHFIAPPNLDLTYYTKNFPTTKYSFFPNEYFESISNYSRLMLSSIFYEKFYNFSHVLICQPDAVVLRPELPFWLDQPYDYIGAPWPNGFEYTLTTDFPHIPEGVKSKTFVGNGGLSLRKISACLELFNEFPKTRQEWISMGHAEDLFFGFTSTLSRKFRTPNIIVAALFSHETQSNYLYKLTGSITPFGCHAYEIHAPDLWNEAIKINFDYQLD